jgi:hypothetical protein
VLILVDHPNPAEVVVIPPELPPVLSLDQVRTGIRLERPQKRLTMVEFIFIPRWEGPLTLKPFTVIVPGGQAVTPELTAYAGGEGGLPASRPRLIWETGPPALRAGESGEYRLRLLDRDPEKALPGPFFRRIRPPPDCLVEEVPLIPADRERDVILRLRIIPLKAGELRFDPVLLAAGTEALEIPGLRIPVLPAIPKEREPDGALGNGPSAPPVSDGVGAVSPRPSPAARIPFPELPPGGFFPFKKAYARTLEPIGWLWDEGRRAEALARLREKERDSLIGPSLAPIRGLAEEALGLERGQNETPLALIALIIAMILVLPASLLVFLKFRPKPTAGSVTSGVSRGYWIAGIAAAFILGLGLFLFFTGASAGGVRPGKSAVLRQTGAYQVPDSVDCGSGENAGAAKVHFGEGERVLIRAAAGAWVYVESFDGKADGRAGWVPSDRLIPY